MFLQHRDNYHEIELEYSPHLRCFNIYVYSKFYHAFSLLIIKKWISILNRRAPVSRIFIKSFAASVLFFLFFLFVPVETQFRHVSRAAPGFAL